MSTLINPLLQYPFSSTDLRFRSLFRPIQKTRDKKSDLLAYLTTPVFDFFVLDALFVLDISIRAINALASILKGIYIWTQSQQNTTSLLDASSKGEFTEAYDNISMICSSLTALTLNWILSAACLVTRPIASTVELCTANNSSLRLA